MVKNGENIVIIEPWFMQKQKTEVKLWPQNKDKIMQQGFGRGDSQEYGTMWITIRKGGMSYGSRSWSYSVEHMDRASRTDVNEHRLATIQALHAITEAITHMPNWGLRKIGIDLLMGGMPMSQSHGESQHPIDKLLDTPPDSSREDLFVAIGKSEDGARFFGFDEDRGLCFAVMEIWCKGGSFRDCDNGIDGGHFHLDEHWFFLYEFKLANLAER